MRKSVLVLTALLVVVALTVSRVSAKEKPQIIVCRVADKLVAMIGDNVTLYTIVYNPTTWSLANVSFWFLIPYDANPEVLYYDSGNGTITKVNRTRWGWNVSVLFRPIVPQRLSKWIHRVVVRFRAEAEFDIEGGRMVVGLSKGEYQAKFEFRLNDVHLRVVKSRSSPPTPPPEGRNSPLYFLLAVLIAPFLVMRAASVRVRRR